MPLLPRTASRDLWALKLLLAAGSAYFLVYRTIEIRLEEHAAWEWSIFHNEAMPPYQYRVLLPFLSLLLKSLVLPLGIPHNAAHLLIYVGIAFAIFVLLYHEATRYLRLFCPERHVVPGLLLLALLAPLTSGLGFPELENFLQLAFFLLAIRWITEGRDGLVMILAFVATLNREQMIWIVPLHLAWHLSQGTLARPRTWIVAFGIGLAWLAAYSLPILVYGLKPTMFTIPHHIAENTSAFRWLHNTGPIWALVALPLFAAGLASWRRLHPFLLAASALTPLYTLLFFLKGNLWEMAKYDLAFVLLFPAILATLHGEGQGPPEGTLAQKKR